MTTVSGSGVASLSTSVTPGLLESEVLEKKTRQIGRELFGRIGRGPSPWHRVWWDERLMNWSLSDPQVRVQLFRFIDALPSLRSVGSVRRHLAEYLGGGRQTRALVAEAGGRPGSGWFGSRTAAGLVGAFGRNDDGSKVHRWCHARTGHQDACWACATSRWPSRSTSWARR